MVHPSNCAIMTHDTWVNTYIHVYINNIVLMCLYKLTGMIKHRIVKDCICILYLLYIIYSIYYTYDSLEQMGYQSTRLNCNASIYFGPHHPKRRSTILSHTLQIPGLIGGSPWLSFFSVTMSIIGRQHPKYGYGSKSITIFGGINIHKSQLFWGTYGPTVPGF